MKHWIRFKGLVSEMPREVLRSLVEDAAEGHDGAVELLCLSALPRLLALFDEMEKAEDGIKMACVEAGIRENAGWAALCLRVREMKGKEKDT